MSALDTLLAGSGATEAAMLPARIDRILALRWGAYLHGEALEEDPPAVDFGDPRVAALLRDERLRFMFGRDRHAAFWLREGKYVVLLMTIALQSEWLAGTSRPLPTELLARRSGLSDRMVRVTLGFARATGDLILQSPAGSRASPCYALSPAMAAAIIHHRLGVLTMMAEFHGRRLPDLPPPAMTELQRLLCLMQLTHTDPVEPGGPPRSLRRSLAFLIVDLLIDPPLPLAELVQRAALRLRVTQMTVRNTIARGQDEGWFEPGPVPRATPMARARFGQAVGAILLRWSLLLDLMELLSCRPELVPELRRTLTRAIG